MPAPGAHRGRNMKRSGSPYLLRSLRCCCTTPRRVGVFFMGCCYLVWRLFWFIGPGLQSSTRTSSTIVHLEAKPCLVPSFLTITFTLESGCLFEICPTKYAEAAKSLWSADLKLSNCFFIVLTCHPIAWFWSDGLNLVAYLGCLAALS